MRTNEERTRLIHKRTAEIKRENQKKKQRRLDAACIAACLLLAGVSESGVSHASGAASLVGSHAALGYILMELLAFLLGVCVTVLLYRLRRRKERRQREDRDDEL